MFFCHHIFAVSLLHILLFFPLVLQPHVGIDSHALWSQTLAASLTGVSSCCSFVTSQTDEPQFIGAINLQWYLQGRVII